MSLICKIRMINFYLFRGGVVKVMKENKFESTLEGEMLFVNIRHFMSQKKRK